jgi:UDP-galactose transporter B1
VTMARTKQATPLRREPSSEYTSKADGYGTPSRSARNLDRDTNGTSNGSEILGSDTVRPIIPETKKDAGIVQLLFAVGGIYGSL